MRRAGGRRGTCLMADVAECIGKLVATKAISQAVADEAMNMFQRSKEEYSKQIGPAGADAAAALQAAKALRDRAADKQLAIAHGVQAWRATERRVIEDPRGGLVQIGAMDSKDTMRGSPSIVSLLSIAPICTRPPRGSSITRRSVARQAWTPCAIASCLSAALSRSALAACNAAAASAPAGPICFEYSSFDRWNMFIASSA